MSLNDLRLTPQLIADLYGAVLMEPIEQKAAGMGVNALGGNKKNILIIVAKEPDVVLPQGELAFFSSVLAACKLSLEDVLILNRNTLENQDYKTLLHQYESRFVLLFGVTPLQFGLPMDFPPFQIQAFDSRQYLYAPDLLKIQEHKGLKGELWTALKKLFLL